MFRVGQKVWIVHNSHHGCWNAGARLVVARIEKNLVTVFAKEDPNFCQRYETTDLWTSEYANEEDV